MSHTLAVAPPLSSSPLPPSRISHGWWLPPHRLPPRAISREHKSLSAGQQQTELHISGATPDLGLGASPIPAILGPGLGALLLLRTHHCSRVPGPLSSPAVSAALLDL